MTAGRLSTDLSHTNASLSVGALVAELAAAVEDTLRLLIPHGSACALLDFPVQTNAGDSAIWLGERECLRRAGAAVVFACHRATYLEGRLAARVRRGTILLHGGGNLGDLWPESQRFREDVISAFPGNRVIQFPQWIHFDERASLDRARTVFDDHPDLVLLVRDHRSLEIARNEFAATTLLCPDMAFLLGPMARPAPPQTDILWLSRTDKEASGRSLASTRHDVTVLDWRYEEHRAAAAFRAPLDRQILFPPRRIPGSSRFVSWLYDPLARIRLLQGIRLLSTARVVVSDRLHGHILCILLGIPHVLLDTRQGKARSFYETWTHRCELTRWADTPDEALDIARTLVARTR